MGLLNPYCYDCNAAHWPADCPKKVKQAVPNKPVLSPNKGDKLGTEILVSPKKVALLGDKMVEASPKESPNVSPKETRNQRWRRLHPDRYRAGQRELMRKRRAR